MYTCIVSRACSWQSWFEILISFVNVTAPFYPNLDNYTYAIGNFRVGINPADNLRSRDGNSPVAITT